MTLLFFGFPNLCVIYMILYCPGRYFPNVTRTIFSVATEMLLALGLHGWQQHCAAAQFTCLEHAPYETR